MWQSSVWAGSQKTRSGPAAPATAFFSNETMPSTPLSLKLSGASSPAGPQSNACILLDLPRCLAKAASSADRRPYWHPTSTRAKSGPPSQRHSMAFLSAEGMAQTLPGPGADGFLPEAMSRW